MAGERVITEQPRHTPPLEKRVLLLTPEKFGASLIPRRQKIVQLLSQGKGESDPEIAGLKREVEIIRARAKILEGDTTAPTLDVVRERQKQIGAEYGRLDQTKNYDYFLREGLNIRLKLLAIRAEELKKKGQSPKPDKKPPTETQPHPKKPKPLTKPPEVTGVELKKPIPIKYEAQSANTQELSAIYQFFHKLQRSGDVKEASGPFPTGGYLLWQEVQFGPDRREPDHGSFRGYLMVEPQDIARTLKILYEVARTRSHRGATTDFKWLMMTYPPGSVQETTKHISNPNNIGRYKELGAADPRIVIYADNSNTVQHILADIASRPEWESIEKNRIQKFGGIPNAAPRRPGTNSFYFRGREYRSLNYNNKPGYSEHEAADPNWRAKKAGTPSVPVVEKKTEAIKAPAPVIRKVAVAPPQEPVPRAAIVEAKPSASVPVETRSVKGDLIKEAQRWLRESRSNNLRLETDPQTVAGYIESLSIPKAKGISFSNVKIQIDNQNRLVASGEAKAGIGWLSKQVAAVNFTLENDSSKQGQRRVKVANYRYDLDPLAVSLAKTFGVTDQQLQSIDGYVSRINDLITQALNGKVGPEWEVNGFQISGGKLTMDFRRKKS